MLLDVLSRLRMPLAMLTGLSLMISLSACGTKAGIGIEASCSQWDYLYASPVDSLETVRQIYANNVKREAFCDGA